MKSNKKITKVRLQAVLDDESRIFGLVSADPDYKLSLLINKKFNISLKNTAPLTLNNNGEDDLTFSRFSSHAGAEMTWTLFSNRSGRNHLIEKLRNVDFLLHLSDPENEMSDEEVNLKLREIGSVTAVFTVDKNSLKDKNLKYLIR
jgi:hypothetical protein